MEQLFLGALREGRNRTQLPLIARIGRALAKIAH
jgi:hypothetical protein